MFLKIILIKKNIILIKIKLEEWVFLNQDCYLILKNKNKLKSKLVLNLVLDIYFRLFWDLDEGIITYY